jgi:hypothetical protein
MVVLAGARQPYSFNEAVTLSAAQRPFVGLWALLAHTDAPLGVYYALMHLWVWTLRAFDVPMPELALRAPSVIATIVSTYLVFRLART